MTSKLKIVQRMFSSLPSRKSQVCIIGAGPAGFYAAMHIVKKNSNVNIDIYDKLPAPFGLIRYGVAPDHPEVKNVINQFTKIAQLENVNFYGNITLGRDVNIIQLQNHYDAVLLTYGAEEDRTLDIENEYGKNIVAARNFVGWYNGLPSEKNLKIDLSGHAAAIIGQGNVALDVARILLTPVDELRKTDITEHALNTLVNSNIKEVYLIGRRGPLQVAFTIKELREQLKLPRCQTVWRKDDFIGIKEFTQDLPRPRKRLMELILKSVNESSDSHKCLKYFKPVFFRSPNKFLLDEQNCLTGIELTCNKVKDNGECLRTNAKEVINCNIAFRSIGYKSLKLDNMLPYTSHGLIVNDKGRVISYPCPPELGRIYVAGWLGTGPVGVILHTMGNAFQVAKSVCEDISSISTLPKGGFEGLKKTMNTDRIVDWKGWEKIDRYEIAQGKKYGKPREKVCDVDKMIEIANT